MTASCCGSNGRHSQPGSRRRSGPARRCGALERDTAAGDPVCKLAAIRRAAENRFPTADIEQVLREIEQGYLDVSDP